MMKWMRIFASRSDLFPTVVWTFLRCVFPNFYCIPTKKWSCVATNRNWTDTMTLRRKQKQQHGNPHTGEIIFYKSKYFDHKVFSNNIIGKNCCRNETITLSANHNWSLGLENFVVFESMLIKCHIIQGFFKSYHKFIIIICNYFFVGSLYIVVLRNRAISLSKWVVIIIDSQ